jgi:hypothetical protein
MRSNYYGLWTCMGNEVNAQIALNSLGWETLKVQSTKAKAKLMF